MSGGNIPLHRALRRLPAPRRLLTIEDMRSRLETPPSQPVEWIGTDIDSGREERTWSQHWKSARDICAAMLGVQADRVECVRADEKKLSGSGAA
jgi:hypothetical protein